MDNNNKKPILLVMAAGMGSRYGGVKQIDAIGENGETLLDYSIYDALNSGFGKIIFVIRRDIERDFRERLFDRIAKNTDAEYVFQEKTTFMPQKYISEIEGRAKPWGTVQCVLAAYKQIDTSFATLNSDDFYGKGAFSLMSNHFKNNCKDNVLIGYLLKNTLSLKGGVTRGVCRLKDDYLVSLSETYDIKKEADGSVSAKDENGNILKLTGDETASMNFFGFKTDTLSFFENYWASFIDENHQSLKAECLLPNAVGSLIEKGLGNVRVYPTSEKWFGMTYPEDKEIVHNSIAFLVKSGVYPSKLYKYN